MKNTPLQEYDYLRSEIMQKIELHNSLLTFTITTTVAILALAISEDRTILYLLPFCIIIPMSMRIAYYKTTVEKLSAYMIVFLEKDLDDLNWETRNSLLLKRNHKKWRWTVHKLPTIRYFECLILSIFCYGLYVFDFIKYRELNCQAIILMLLPSLLVLWEIIVTIRTNSEMKEKQMWIDQWSKLKDEQ